MKGRAETLILMAAGGTGGHVYPALAVAVALREEGYQVHWVGTRQGIEYRLVNEAQMPLHILPAKGVRGKAVIGKVVGLAILCWGALRAIALLLKLSPACVVGMGGYAAGPAGIAAWLLRVPLVIHEQNAVAGTTNRLLAPLATRVYGGFDGAFAGRDNVHVVGNPVRETLLERADSSELAYTTDRPLRLLVLGGSLGAQPINQLMPATLRKMMQLGKSGDIEVYHQSGMSNLQTLLEDYADLVGNGVRVEPYIDDMASAYAWADLVLCRAGALTIAELAVMGRPSLLVPLPHAIDDHQTANALYLTRQGAGLLLPQDTLDADLLTKTLLDCRADPDKLSAMARAATRRAHPQATRDIAVGVEELVSHA